MLSGLIDYKELPDNKVEIITESMLSGETRQTVIDRNYNEFLNDIVSYIEGEKLIQEIFFYLDASTREMLITGITPEEWDASFGSDN